MWAGKAIREGSERTNLSAIALSLHMQPVVSEHRILLQYTLSQDVSADMMKAEGRGRDFGSADHPFCMTSHNMSLNPTFSQLVGFSGRSPYITANITAVPPPRWDRGALSMKS
jgi:hypothetical protein